MDYPNSTHFWQTMADVETISLISRPKSPITISILCFGRLPYILCYKQFLENLYFSLSKNSLIF